MCKFFEVLFLRTHFSTFSNGDVLLMVVSEKGVHIVEYTTGNFSSMSKLSSIDDSGKHFILRSAPHMPRALVVSK